MEHSFPLLRDIAFSIILAAVCAHIAKLLRQPLIVGYVCGGILLGVPMGFGLVASPESIELISEIGLLFLLFIIGLEINLRELLRMGKSMLALGVVQFLGCAGIGFLIYTPLLAGKLTGNYDILYLSITTALSSTLIVVKLLADKFEVHTTAGKLTVGVLVFQDIWAMLFMAFQPNLLNPEWAAVLRSMGLGILLIAGAFLVSRYGLMIIFKSASKKTELILLTATMWCFLLSGLAEKAGLSKEMGALIAGLSLAAFPYGVEVISKILGVRDFFVTLFFVALGLKMPRPDLGMCIAAFGVAGIVLLTRIATVMPVVAAAGNGLRIGLVTAINLAQISEFALVIVSLGMSYKHVSETLQTLILTSMLLTSVLASYGIYFNGRIAAFIMKIFGLLTLRHMRDRHHSAKEKNEIEIVLLGCFREGLAFLDMVERHIPQLKSKILVVDFNEALAESLTGRGFTWHYGDLANMETLEHLGIEKSHLIICSLSDTYLKGTTSERLAFQLRKLAPHAALIMTADDIPSSVRLKQAGASDVAVESQLTGRELFNLLQRRMAL